MPNVNTDGKTNVEIAAILSKCIGGHRSLPWNALATKTQVMLTENEGDNNASNGIVIIIIIMIITIMIIIIVIIITKIMIIMIIIMVIVWSIIKMIIDNR